MPIMISAIAMPHDCYNKTKTLTQPFNLHIDFLKSRSASNLRKISGPATWIFFLGLHQRYTYRVLRTIQMKLILLCVWAERAVLGSAKTALKFKYEI